MGAGIGAFVTIAIDQHLFGLGQGNPTPDVRIVAAASRVNAPTYDDPAAEYVCLVNSEGEPVDITAWQLREGSGDVVNKLPSFALAPGAGVRVHPGRGRNSPDDLFGDNAGPVWTNSGDSITLVDSDERLVARASYGRTEEDDTVAPCE